jgi:4-hydroxybenzoate polyprenyltransferase/phosphoserine phosphatase
VSTVAGSPAPLVVDLDGTLTPTDTLAELIVRVVRQRPLDALLTLLWLLRGRAALKAQLASRVPLRPETLPYREVLCRFISAERARGRSVILATASAEAIAQSVAAHLGCFDAVLASDSRTNLKGAAKLRAIRESVGARFAYAGDSAADLPIWREAESAILVATSRSVSAGVRRHTPVEFEVPRSRAGVTTWVRQLRLHQCLKNLLIFVPLLTSFTLGDLALLMTAVWAFLAFSMAASSAYILNDLWDLDSDRAHARKRHRPLASGRISIRSAAMTALILLAASLGLAWAIEATFFWLVLVYLFSSIAYSWRLKTYVVLDVVVLSGLYTLRILAGSAAVTVNTSFWLLAFSVFLFLSLALIKRCTELQMGEREAHAATPGRDYRMEDLAILWPMGVAAGLSAVVVFALFVSAAETASRYATPQLLWLVGVGLIYWLGRLWIKTARGEMHDDPLLFTLRNRGSRVTILAMLLVMLAARFVHMGSGQSD